MRVFLSIAAVILAPSVVAAAALDESAQWDNSGHYTRRALAPQPVKQAVRKVSKSRRGARHRRVARAHASPHEGSAAVARGYCTEQTKAGPIVVSCRIAPRMKGFVDDVVDRGFHGRVKCFSLSRSHVPHSLHFIAEACDFAQRGWNKTVAVMYRVGDLARKWGLRDGCTFRRPDCGHVDSGRLRAARVARKPHVATK